MSDEKIRNDIRVEFYNMVLNVYNEYSSDRTILNKEIYNKILELYTKLNKATSIYDVKVCLKDIQTEIDKLRVLYNQKIKSYNALDKKSEEAEIVYRDIKDIAKMAQSLTDAYSNIKIIMRNHSLAKKDTVSDTKTIESEIQNISNPVMQDVKLEENITDTKEVVDKKISNPVVQESKVEEKIENVKEVDLSNPSIKEIHSLSDEILVLKEKLNSMDAFSSDANKLRNQINILCERREKIVFDAFGYEGTNFVRVIESLETRYVNTPNIKSNKPVILNENEYLKEFDEVIECIGDLKFNSIKSKYVHVNSQMSKDEMFAEYKRVYAEIMDRFLELTSSLHGTNHPVIYSESDYSLSTFDLISYLDVYNISGNYGDFKAHHKSGKIGNEVVSRELYSKGLDIIEGMISSFKSLSSDIIRQNGGKVIVQNNKSEKQIIKSELDKKMNELYENIRKKSNKKEF